MATLTGTNWQEKITALVESDIFSRSITILIIVNALILGLETSSRLREIAGPVFSLVNQVIIAVFVLELLLKLLCYRLRFFVNGWNWFDFAIVVISVVPSQGGLAILRSLRLLRVLRLLSTVRQLRMLVDSLLEALPGIGWSAVLLLIFFYIFGVMGVSLFGNSFPEWFGTLGASLYTLFQIMTLESWSMGIARPVMQAYPYAWLYFTPFILVASFMVLNLFIAIIVSATQEIGWKDGPQAQEAERAHQEREEMLELMRQLVAKIDHLEQGNNKSNK